MIFFKDLKIGDEFYFPRLDQGLFGPTTRIKTGKFHYVNSCTGIETLKENYVLYDREEVIKIGKTLLDNLRNILIFNLVYIVYQG